MNPFCALHSEVLTTDNWMCDSRRPMVYLYTGYMFNK